jgi:hypothetical protein
LEKEKGLLSHSIAGKNKFFLLVIPKGQGKSSSQMPKKINPVEFIEMGNDLAVAPGTKSDTLLLQVSPEFDKVIYFPVDDGGYRSGLIEERLASSFEVNDGEAAMGEVDIGSDQCPETIRASMRQVCA